MAEAGRTGPSGWRLPAHSWGFSSSEESRCWLRVCLLPPEWALRPLPLHPGSPRERACMVGPGLTTDISWKPTRPPLSLSDALMPLFPFPCPSFPSLPTSIHLACQFPPHESEVRGPSTPKAGKWGSNLLETCLCANRQRPSPTNPSQHTITTFQDDD